MFCTLRLPWAILLVAGIATESLGATVSIAARSFEFSGDTSIEVPILLEDSVGLAGVDFVVEYDLADFAGGANTSHVSGGLLTLLEVNHEFATDTLAETRRIKVAGASAQGLGVDGGTLLTLTLGVTCAGNAQAFPTGRTVRLRILDVHAFDELGAAMAASGNDGLLNLRCTSVATEAGPSLSTLKSFYRD